MPMRWMLACLAIGLTLAACASAGPKGGEAARTTQTYRYQGEPEGDAFHAVSRKAYDYCLQRYGSMTRLKSMWQNDQGNYVVFECL